jgi:hypothetical protein
MLEELSQSPRYSADSIHQLTRSALCPRDLLHRSQLPDRFQRARTAQRIPVRHPFERPARESCNQRFGRGLWQF